VRILVGVAETIVAVLGLVAACAPWAIAFAAPLPLWGRGFALLGFGGLCCALSLLVDRRAGWGGWRDMYTFGAMLSSALGVVTLIVAGVKALM